MITIPVSSPKVRKVDHLRHFLKRRGGCILIVFLLVVLAAGWYVLDLGSCSENYFNDKTVYLRATQYRHGLPVDEKTGEPKRLTVRNYLPSDVPRSERELNANFSRILSDAERRSLLETFRICVQLLKQLKYPPILFDGSLLGLYRHNSSFIPWDDDIDVAIVETGPSKLFGDKLAEQLSELGASQSFKAYNKPGHNVIKVFNLNGTVPVIGENGRDDLLRWPYMDIFLLSAFSIQSDQGGFDISHKPPSVFFKWIEDPFFYPFEIMFPLQEVTFESVQLYAPRNIRAVLELTYDDLEKCSTRIWGHRQNHPFPSQRQVNCSALSKRYVITHHRL